MSNACWSRREFGFSLARAMRLPESAIRETESRYADGKFVTRPATWWVDQVRVAAGAL